jgi:hypothetical protein
VINLGGTNVDTSDVDTVALFTDVGGNPGTMIAGAYAFFQKTGSTMWAWIKPTSALVVPKDETLRVHVVLDINAGADTSHDVRVSVLAADSLKARGKYSGRYVTKTGTFPIRSDDMSLPVELSAFYAQQTSNSVILKWRTESETRNQGFYVYRSRSSNGPFTRLNYALIPGAGSSETYHEYEFQDLTVRKWETYWYKIADIDLTGVEYVHEPAIEVLFTGTANGNLAEGIRFLDAHPFTKYIRFAYCLAMPGEVQISIYDMHGQIVYSKAEEYIGGWSLIEWNGRNINKKAYQAGLYLVEIQSTSKVIRRAFLKLE